MFTGPSLNSSTRSETCPALDLLLTANVSLNVSLNVPLAVSLNVSLAVSLEIACMETPTFRENAVLY
jgi:hypothetical protein